MVIRTGVLPAPLVLGACSGPAWQRAQIETITPGQAPAVARATLAPSITATATLPQEQTATPPSAATTATAGSDGTATAESVLPDEAMRTLEAFMQARVARADRQARELLAPEIRQTVPYEQLVSTSSPRGLTYTVLDAHLAAGGVVEATVQIALGANPVGAEVMGFSTQSIRLEQCDGRWLVAALGELVDRPTR